MPFVVDEKGKENVVPVRLLSKERLVFLDADCMIGNGPRQRLATETAEEREARLATSLVRARAIYTCCGIRGNATGLAPSDPKLSDKANFRRDSHSLCARFRSPKMPYIRLLVIGEWERANLVVRTARITSSNCECSRITRFFLSERISKLHMLPACEMSCIYMCIL